jgi:hypothetical protein
LLRKRSVPSSRIHVETAFYSVKSLDTGRIAKDLRRHYKKLHEGFAMLRKVTLRRHIIRAISLSLFLTVTTAAFLSSPSFALTDSTKEIPANVPNWKFTDQRMDTGEARSCHATGGFGEYAIDIQMVPEGSGGYSGGYGYACNGMCDSITIKFKSTRPYSVGNIRGTAPSDYGTCAAGRSTDAPAGTLHSNQGSAPYVDLCDGAHDWHAVSEKKNPAELSFDGKANAPGEVQYIIDEKIGTPFIYSFSAEFQPKNMLDKLLGASTLKISARESNFQPAELKDLNLPQVASALQNCLKAKK